MKNDVILKVENLSKQYRLGLIGTGTISHDLNRFFAKIRGKEDPYLKVGEQSNRTSTKKTDYVWALKNINFEVKRGEVLGIIGKNGAGKSTLLKILSKVTGPTTGSIKSKGRIASLLEVGTGFHPEMTGRENIFLNGAILGMTKKEIKSKLDEIVSFSGCQLYIDTPVKRYSSGMKVRLAFAVAAHLEPDILIVDEVLAVGDAEFQKKAIGKMQDISGSDGRTVLFVSHNMAAVKNLCTSLTVLENGKSVFSGNVIEGIEFYLSNQSKLANTKLKDRKDRKGSGDVLFSKIELFNEKEKLVNEFVSEEQVKFRIHLDYKRKVIFKDLVFGLVIYDLNENKIADFYSDEMDFRISKEQGFIDLNIPSLLLRGGEYTITLVVQTKDGVVKKLDLVKNVVNFKVIPNDFWKVKQVNRATNVAILNGRFTL